MDFGVVLQCDPPARDVVALAQQAEAAGFSHVWTFDSHVLWQEPFVIYSQILAATQKVMVGPMVTNPSTRDWTVTASQFATLNEMFGNRTICGIGRGDSAVRAGGDPAAVKFCVAAPAYVGADLAHQREQTRWFGGMVGNHVADIVARYGADGAVPSVLTDYIKGRQGYDYAEHGRAGNTHTEFVPDEVVDRCCVLRPVEAHVKKLQELRKLGLDEV